MRSAADTARRLYDFIAEIEGMKVQTRTAWSSNGRQESVAEHSWRLAMIAFALAPHLPRIDRGRLLEMCLVHDLGEVFEGDISAPAQDPHDGAKARQERDAVEMLREHLGGEAGEKLYELWEEYEAGASPEARVAKVLDKLETIIQHNQGDNPAGFDYGYNLGYGAHLPHDSEVLRELRALADRGTRERAGE